MSCSHQLWPGNYSPGHQSCDRGKYKYFWRRDRSSIGGINIRVMLISELWQGSVTAWGWPHRDIPCHHDTSLRWSPPQLTPRINIVISDARTTPREHSEQQPTIKCGSDRENKSWAPGERRLGIKAGIIIAWVSLSSLYSIDHCVFDVVCLNPTLGARYTSNRDNPAIGIWRTNN